MPGQDASGPRYGCTRTYDMVTEHFVVVAKYECSYCEMLVVRDCGVRQNFYVFSLYRNLDADDRTFDCLLTSMSATQAEDLRVSFLFVGDFTGHHQEWLGSMTTNRHGAAAFDSATVSGCDQLVVAPTHARSGTLNLRMTDVLDLQYGLLL